MTQLLLFPDPRPLVERLGAEFFRRAPELPGVYLMRDRADAILYVGKAKNLRKRLANYRVANPERMGPRHLRLLRAVERIELQTCSSESSALARESALLRSLRPRFNRAGTWAGPARFLSWRMTHDNLELAVKPAVEPSWTALGPLGASAHQVCAALARLLWCASHPHLGAAGLPQGWFEGRPGEIWVILAGDESVRSFNQVVPMLDKLGAGNATELIRWIQDSTRSWRHVFDLTARETDLETVSDFAKRAASRLDSERSVQ